MPLLKFRCRDCGHVFDELVALGRVEDVRCPDCGGEVERAYEGKCISAQKGDCTGNCSGCHGCGSS